MNLVSSNKIKKIFLCSNIKIYENSKVDIILSPEFYWVRLFDIPVKNIAQAKAVLPSLFEDILLKVDELSYQVIKLEEGKYLCFAYINKKIFESIKNSGISLSLVNAVYFAQNECKDFKQFSVGNKSFLYTNDNILVKVPNNILSEKIELNDFIENINLSSNKIDIKLYNNLLSSKQIKIVLIVCSIISLVNFSKYFVYKSEISKQEKKIEEIRTSNKREALSYILSNNIDIKTIFLENDILEITVLNIDKKRIEEYISKRYKIVSSSISGLNLNIKVQL